jgi:arabinofuranosyltransferase
MSINKQNISLTLVERMETWLHKRWSFVLIGLIAIALATAWRCHFIQDDAFISFNYARSLVEGEGLTWFGTRIEGYTNFLWVLWIAMGLKVGANPVAWSYVGGLTAFVLTIIALSRLAYSLFRKYVPTLLAILLFITNYSVLSYATGGLETMLQTALLCTVATMVWEMILSARYSCHRCVFLSVFLALAVMTRLDSALPGAVMGLGLLHGMWKKRSGWRSVAGAIVPGAMLLGVWFLWKISYYNGELLPNTFYAKAEGGSYSMAFNGIIFIIRFIGWYLLWPFLGLGLVVVWWKKRWKVPQGMPLMGILLLTWMGYLICVGGDFMEFRFMVPIMPFLVIFLAYTIYQEMGESLFARPLLVSIVAFIILGFASIMHARNFDGITSDKTLDSIPSLSTCYGLYPDGKWSLLGDRLYEELSEFGATIALKPVGAIPYYSRLTTVDQWGLNDSIVASEGMPASSEYRRPGHRRHATLSYLRERGVNFVIGHPILIPRGILNEERVTAGLTRWVSVGAISFNTESVTNATVVAMPVNDEVAMLMWYLTPSSPLDAAIERSGWESRILTVADYATDE